MEHENRVCASAFSLPLLRVLFTEGRISRKAVVKIEERRFNLGITLSPIEERMMRLLLDELLVVDEILDSPGIDAAVLNSREREVYLWWRISELRSAWDSLVEPQFDVEELLDQYDAEGRYVEARFFRDLPRRERGVNRYIARLDGVLERNLRRLCDGLDECYGACD